MEYGGIHRLVLQLVEFVKRQGWCLEEVIEIDDVVN